MEWQLTGKTARAPEERRTSWKALFNLFTGRESSAGRCGQSLNLRGRSIPARIVRLVGEQPPLIPDAAQHRPPEGVVLPVAHQVARHGRDHPGLLLELPLQLAAGPAGIAEKRAEVHPLFRRELRGLFRLDPEVKLEPLVLRLPRREDQLL